MRVAVRVAYEREVAACGNRHTGYRAFGVTDTVVVDPRRRREHFLTKHAIFQPPRVRPRLPNVTRHHVRPVPFPRFAVRD